MVKHYSRFAEQQQKRCLENLLFNITRGNYRKISRIVMHNNLTKNYLKDTHIEQALKLAIDNDDFYAVHSIVVNTKLTFCHDKKEIITYYVKKALEPNFDWLEKSGTIIKYFGIYNLRFLLKINSGIVNDVIINIIREKYIDTENDFNIFISEIESNSKYCKTLKCNCYTCEHAYITIIKVLKNYCLSKKLHEKILELEPKNKSFIVFLLHSLNKFDVIFDVLNYKYPLRKNIDLTENIIKIKSFCDVIVFLI